MFSDRISLTLLVGFGLSLVTYHPALAQLPPPPPPQLEQSDAYRADDPNVGWTDQAAIARGDWQHLRSPTGQMPPPPVPPPAFGAIQQAPNHPDPRLIHRESWDGWQSPYLAYPRAVTPPRADWYDWHARTAYHWDRGGYVTELRHESFHPHYSVIYPSARVNPEYRWHDINRPGPGQHTPYFGPSHPGRGNWGGSGGGHHH